MSKTLKLEISVADLGQNGVVVSEFATTDYVANELSKKATLNAEGKVDPSLLPDYTYLDGLVDKLDDVEQSFLNSDAEILNAAKLYSDNKIAENNSKKADLVEGKVPFEQLPFSMNFEQNVSTEFGNVRQELRQNSESIVSQMEGLVGSANSYTDDKVLEEREFLNNTINEYKGEVNSQLNNFDNEIGAAKNTQDDIIKNGASLPYDPDLEYVEGALTLKDGELQQFVGGVWLPFNKTVNASDVINESGKTQQEINNGLNSIAEMLAISNPKSGNRVYVKSYHNGLNKGGGFFVYELTKAGVNDGGVVINGWVRQDESNLDVYMFGAYGNWNATTQQGSDDSIAFQHYAEYLNKNMLNPRAGGGKKVMFIRGGSYRLKGFTITQDESAYWSFLLKGESTYTNLWFDPTGSGIVLQNENSGFRDITLNGNITTSSVGAIDYIVTGKLKNKLADVDVGCDNVSVMFYKNFAKIHGRGFTFRNGGAGKGTGVVCEINTDDIVFGGSHSGDTPEGGLRHYVFSESRIDDASGVFSVVGSGAAKDHVHGIQITGNQIKSCSNLIRSADCTIRRVVLAKNVAFGLKTIAFVPKIDGLVDMGNQWANEWRAITPIQSESSRLAWGYACSSYVRNALVCGSQFSDLFYSLFMIGKDTYLSTANPLSSYNINVMDNTFLNFGVTTALRSCVIDNATELTAVSIEKNFLQGNTAHVKNWINGLPDKSDSIIIKNNVNRAGFIQQQLSFTPKLYIGSIEKNVTESKSYYSVDGNYIDVTMFLYFPKTLLDGSSGVLSFSLPTNTYEFENSAISLAFSGSGVVEQAAGFTNRPTYVFVNRTTMRLELKSSIGTDISTSDVSASTAGCTLCIKYRAKVRAT